MCTCHISRTHYLLTYLLTYLQPLRQVLEKIRHTKNLNPCHEMLSWAPNMPKLLLRLGLRPGPRWGSLQRSPRLPSWIKGATSKGRGGEGRGWRGELRPFLKFLDPPQYLAIQVSLTPSGPVWRRHTCLAEVFDNLRCGKIAGAPPLSPQLK